MDMLNETCKLCDGKYVETSIHDDLDGMLHCDKCGNATNRHMSEQKYIGEEIVDIKETSYKDHTPTDWALTYIRYYGGTDGGHHKQWVLDQVARILNGTPVIVRKATWEDPHLVEYRFTTGEPSEKYLQWVKEYKDGEDGPETYDYDEGIVP